VLLNPNYDRSYCSRDKAERAIARFLAELVNSISAPNALKSGVHWVVTQNEASGRWAPVVVIVDPNLIILARSIAAKGYRVYNQVRS
jgi:hypothetical protein